MDGEGLWGKIFAQGVAPGENGIPVLPFGSSLVRVLSYLCGWRNNLTVWYMSPGFSSLTQYCSCCNQHYLIGPCYLGSNGLFLNDFIMTYWPGIIACKPSGGVCQHDSTLSLALCTAFVRFSQSGDLRQCVNQHF